jgi:predicted transposase YbfD/YdcC
VSRENYNTLWSHVQCIPDPRNRRGRRYEWTYILTLLAAAMLAGQKSILAMSQWINMNEAALVEALKPNYERVPSYATLRRALCDVEIEHLEAHLSRYTSALDQEDQASGRIETCDGTKLRGQAIDGKTLRGASAHGAKVHLVSIVRHESGAVLAQTKTKAGIDEGQAAKALLRDFSLVNTVTTMDALYTERPLARQILAAGGDYLMVVKRNQLTLHREIELAFSVLPPTSSWESEFWHYDHALSHESSRGRTEIRRLERTTALNDYLDWPQIGQVMRRTYRRVDRRTGRISEDVHYGITSLSATQISIDQLAQIWRWHWTIENCTHYIRDVSLGEDRCQVHTGTAPRALAALRNTVVTALRLDGWSHVPNGLRHFANFPQDALNFIGAPAT